LTVFCLRFSVFCWKPDIKAVSFKIASLQMKIVISLINAMTWGSGWMPQQSFGQKTAPMQGLGNEARPAQAGKPVLPVLLEFVNIAAALTPDTCPLLPAL
jgi:hypothetical protein